MRTMPRRSAAPLLALVLLAAPSSAGAQVTVTLDKARYASAETMTVTVALAGRARLRHPRILTLGDGVPVPHDSPLWLEFPEVRQTTRLQITAPSFIPVDMDDGSTVMLGPGRWWLLLYDGSRMVARVPFQMTESPDAGPGPDDARGGRAARMTVSPAGPYVRGQRLAVDVVVPGDLPADVLPQLEWAAAPEPGTNGPTPDLDLAAIPPPVSVPHEGGRRIRVYAPAAPGRFSLVLTGGERRLAALIVLVR